MKENNEFNKVNENKRYEDKNYDERNRYDFFVKYYLHLAIGTKYEDCIEITKEAYKELKKVIRKSNKAMIEVFTTYAVGFYQDKETYVIKDVDKEVYYCLFNSQRYERNKTRHEIERHLNPYITQEELSNIPSKYDLELKVIEKMEKEEIKKLLDTILSQKQSDRFFKNRIDNIPFVVIAFQEKSSPDAVRDSVNKAEKKIKKDKNLKKFKKF